MKIKSIKKTNVKKPTWDIEVKEKHCYQLENKVLSHNTISLSLANNACVAKGSIINTSAGKIPIEEVTLDHLVERFDVESNSFIFDEIEFVGLTRSQTQVFEIELGSGKTLRTTFDHEFLVKIGDDLKYESLYNIMKNGYELYEVVVQ